MPALGPSGASKRLRPAVVFSFQAALLLAAPAAGQAPDRYIMGDDAPHLEMIVHIIGEVQRPGEYRVSDRTNVLELFSKAGGPTAYSKLSEVTVTRYAQPPASAPQRSQVMRVDLKEALEHERAAALPMLLPGDVVLVPRNSWNTWRNVAAVARDLSVIASIYLIYTRARD